MKTALYLGRFQPFHKGHKNAVNQILKEYNRIIILIGSSNKKNTERNPMPAKLRKKIIAQELKNIDNKIILYAPDKGLDKAFINNIMTKVKRYNPKSIYTGNTFTMRLFKKYTSLRIRKIKKTIPISSTIIRKNPKKYKKYLSNFTQKLFLENFS